jgi:formylglycine-generating enzyme
VDSTDARESGLDASDVSIEDVVIPDVAEVGPDTPEAAEEAAVPINCVRDGGAPMGAAGTFCIDQTEVTQAEYKKFLEASPALQDGVCATNDSFVPGQQNNGFICSQNLFDPAVYPDSPVRCVDWCDAKAYCQWAGKRLCGKRGGGALDPTAFADPAQSEWMSACSMNGVKKYPYGPVFTPGACHGSGTPSTPALPAVRSAASCVGGFPGLYDMSGDAAEWEDSCDAENKCRLRGGDITGTDTALACDADRIGSRFGLGMSIGLRCCADPQ